MLETAAQFTVNDDGDQFRSTSLLGRDEFDRRLAMARAQVIWPLAVRRHLKGTIYGHAQVRADELGLAKREVLRWWDSYQYKGLMGVLPAGEMPPESRKRWECTLATLEDKLQAERTNWAKQGDRFFVEALRGVVGTGGLRAYLPISQDCERHWRGVLETKSERPPAAHADHDQTSTIDMAQRTGVCREILVAPLVDRAFRDWALEAYAQAWGTTGPTLRSWLNKYDRDQGAKSLTPERLYRPHIAWLQANEPSILALRDQDTRPSAEYWPGLMGEGGRRLLNPAPQLAEVPVPEISATEYPRVIDRYLHLIRHWQGATGLTGLPPKAYNNKLSNYVSWCKSHPESPTAIEFEAAVIPLGISLKRGASSIDRPHASYTDPRGLFESINATQIWCLDRGVVPSILDEDPMLRHLAGWVIRCQTGLISSKHVSSISTSPGAMRVERFVEDVAKLQRATDFAAEWWVFCLRVVKQVERSSKGSGWCELACQRQLRNVVGDLAQFEADLAAMRKGSANRPSSPSPAALISFINETLGKLPNPVSFPEQRSATVAATARLLAEGVVLRDTVALASARG